MLSSSVSYLLMYLTSYMWYVDIAVDITFATYMQEDGYVWL